MRRCGHEGHTFSVEAPARALPGIHALIAPPPWQQLSPNVSHLSPSKPSNEAPVSHSTCAGPSSRHCRSTPPPTTHHLP